MIYIFEGEEPVLINQNISKLIEKNKNFNLIRYDGKSKEFDLDEVFNNWINVDLFGNNSLIIVNDPPFLLRKEENKTLDDFLEYSKHQDNENILVLYTLNGSFKKVLKSYKTISSNAKVVNYEKLKRNDFYNAAITLLKDNDLILDKQSLNTLIQASNSSLSDLKLNVDVLKLYPEKITNDVVSNLLSVPVNYDSFDLINAICNKDVSKSDKLIKEMLKDNDSIIGMISLLSGQLRFLYLLSSYLDDGETPESISSNYGYNLYRVKKAIETLSKLKKNDILRLLNLLCDLDIKVKSQSYLSQKTLFELFILELINEK